MSGAFKVEHTASNMGNGEWMITRNTEARALVGGTPCVLLGVRSYDAYELTKLVEWLDDRAAGYPKRDLPWPPYVNTHISV